VDFVKDEQAVRRVCNYRLISAQTKSASQQLIRSEDSDWMKVKMRERALKARGSGCRQWIVTISFKKPAIQSLCGARVL
jgi:hypothetical protein